MSDETKAQKRRHQVFAEWQSVIQMIADERKKQPFVVWSTVHYLEAAKRILEKQMRELEDGNGTH